MVWIQIRAPILSVIFGKSLKSFVFSHVEWDNTTYFTGLKRYKVTYSKVQSTCSRNALSQTLFPWSYLLLKMRRHRISVAPASVLPVEDGVGSDATGELADRCLQGLGSVVNQRAHPSTKGTAATELQSVVPSVQAFVTIAPCRSAVCALPLARLVKPLLHICKKKYAWFKEHHVLTS